MQSAKAVMTSFLRWKKPLKLTITLDPENVHVAQDIGDNIGAKYIKTEMPFNHLMTEIFEGSNTD